MFIKRYLNFVNESRSKKLETDKSAKEVISEYAPWYLEHNMKDVELYRGLDSDSKFMLIDPSKHHREPVGEENQFEGAVPNYYDLILNNSDEWKKFSDIPRNKSIFCSNDELSVSRYGEDIGGNTYVVIPLKENTEFIMCQSSDLYGAFRYLKMMYSLDMPIFTTRIKQKLDLKSHYETYEKMSNDMKSVSDDKLREFVSYLNETNYKFHNKHITQLEDIKEEGGLLPWLEHLMNPDDNEFLRVKYNHDINFKYKSFITGKTYLNHELWTNKPCLLVRKDLLN